MSQINNRVFVNSMPKSGTHLLGNVINLCGYGSVERIRHTLTRGLGVPRNFAYEAVYRNWVRKFYMTCCYKVEDTTVPIDVTSPIQTPAFLLRWWLDQIPKQKYFIGHVPWSPTSDEILTTLGYKHVFIIRDPRDVLVSFLHFVQRPQHSLRSDFQHLSPQEQFSFAITGGKAQQSNRHMMGIIDSLESVIKWKQSNNSLLVRFEDLIGAQGGGGSKERQFLAVKQICLYLEIDADTAFIDTICQQAFDPSARTFRQGKIGGWRDVLKAEQLTMFYQQASDILTNLGYSVEV